MQEDPIGKRVKLVQVMNCEAGRRGDPWDGPAVAMLTLAHLDQIETPMCIGIRDVRRLTAEFLTILQEFGDQTADAIVCVYVTKGQHGSASLVGDGPPIEPETITPTTKPIRKSATIAPLTSSLQGFGLFMDILIDKRRPPIRFSVLGGYSDGDEIFLLFRNYDFAEYPSEFVAKLGPECTVDLKPKGTEVMDKSWWPAFGKIPVGRQLMICGRLWKKLGRTELRRRIGKGYFTILQKSR